MPPKGSRKSAQPYDRRHENGLAPPAKRVHKSRSNGNLNGQAATSTAAQQSNRAATPSSLAPDSKTSQHPSSVAGHPLSSLPADGRAATNGTAVVPPHMAPGTSSGRFHADDSLRSTSDPSPTANGHHDQYRYRNGSVGGAAGRMPSRKSDASGHVHRMATGLTDVMQLATTIVASCPLYDVIAMLIILLQLPPTILTIVDALFAVLTFVPPATGASLSALPSLSDMFHGSGGQPSLWTVAFLDVVALFGWAFLWVPAQHVALDLAQAVIAISLGGAAAGRSGTMHAVLLCLGLIFPYHAFRYKPTRRFGLRVLSIILNRAGFEVSSTEALIAETPEKTESAPSVFQNVLGVHILTQGVTRLILRALSHRESGPALPSGKKNDPEAAGASRNLRANSTAAEATVDHPSATSTDGRPPGPSPAARDGKERASQARRKKRRSAHVRSQQPFWAALASGKVTFSKQKEQNQANVDALEANAADDHHIGNANFKMEEDRVWITDMGSTEVSFGVSVSCSEGEDHAEDGSTTGLGIDKTKPFYVRVNGATWSSTRIREACSSGEQPADVSIWEGEIFGLTALSNYYCEFVRTNNHEVIHATSLVTSPAPSTEQAAAVTPHNHPSLRPSSPTTTLKNSIAAAEQKLQEHRNRLKRNRKDHKSSITSSKKEVETLSHRLASSGGTDDKLRQRALQLNQNVRQAEEAAAELAEAIQALGEIPEVQRTEHEAMRKRWRQETERKATVTAEIDRCKAEADQKLAVIRNEIATVVQKRDRLLARQNKLNEQHEKLVSTNAQEFDAKARRENERAVQSAQRASVEQHYRSLIAGIEAQVDEIALKTAQAYQQIQQFDLGMNQVAASSQPSAHPIMSPTDGIMPGSMGPGNAAGRGAPNVPGFHYPMAMADQFRTKRGTSLRETRGRSSSMLSDVSGFTDAADELMQTSSPLTMTSPLGATSQAMAGVGFSGPMARKGSKASSGSDGSQRDLMSPRMARTPL
jgi:ubiquitination network signaling protein AcrB